MLGSIPFAPRREGSALQHEDGAGSASGLHPAKPGVPGPAGEGRPTFCQRPYWRPGGAVMFGRSIRSISTWSGGRWMVILGSLVALLAVATAVPTWGAKTAVSLS